MMQPLSVLHIYQQQQRDSLPLHHHKLVERKKKNKIREDAREMSTTGNVPVVLQKIDRGQNKSGSEWVSYSLAFCALPRE
jgi:hypothetical protein